jgi:hypothetical protein
LLLLLLLLLLPLPLPLLLLFAVLESTSQGPSNQCRPKTELWSGSEGNCGTHLSVTTLE